MDAVIEAIKSIEPYTLDAEGQKIFIDNVTKVFSNHKNTHKVKKIMVGEVERVLEKFIRTLETTDFV